MYKFCKGFLLLCCCYASFHIFSPAAGAGAIVSGEPASLPQQVVEVALPSFAVTVNGREIDNSRRAYPFIIYNDITYFPMTYDDCLSLDLDATWSADSGLRIETRDRAVIFPNEERRRAAQDGTNTALSAAIVDFPVIVNGFPIDNRQETYPLLLFRDITYFPLTWRFTVEEFAWENAFDAENGLRISSRWKIMSFAETDTQFYALDNKGQLWTWGEEESWWASDGGDAGRTQPKLLLDGVKSYQTDMWTQLCWAVRNDDSLWIWYKGYPFNYPEALPGYAAPELESESFCAPYPVAENVLNVLDVYPFHLQKRDGSVWGMESEQKP